MRTIHSTRNILKRLLLRSTIRWSETLLPSLLCTYVLGGRATPLAIFWPLSMLLLFLITGRSSGPNCCPTYDAYLLVPVLAWPLHSSILQSRFEMICNLLSESDEELDPGCFRLLITTL